MMGQGIEDAKAMLRYLMKQRELEQAQEQKAFIEGGGRLGDGSETPIPGAAAMKRRVDDTLTEKVVEPMAARGYGDLGAAIATVPSVIADVVLPDTVGELAMPPPVRGGGKGGKVVDLAAKRAEKAEATALARRAGGKVEEVAAKAADDDLPAVKDLVDGRTVMSGPVPNMESIGASLTNYKVLPGVREVSLDKFAYTPPTRATEAKRSRELAEQIKASKEVAPLIVVQDGEGFYILEGSHRFDALNMLGAKSFPAIVVKDLGD